MAARTVTPTTLAAVASGRQEGHILGSRIVALGFIAGRHTAIVSADGQGLAFYHSLGKVLFVDATDVLRILGKYPEEELIATPSSKPNSPARNGSTTAAPRPGLRPQRKAGTILSMSALPLGTAVHATDAYQLVALLTPVKLVIIGLKPSPKTWFRRHREGEDNLAKSSRWRGCLAWFPSIERGEPSENGAKSSSRKKDVNAVTNLTDPLLAFSWGRTFFILRTTEVRTVQKVQNKKSGKIEKVESGKVNFQDHGYRSSHADILALQWLNANVSPCYFIGSL